MSGLRIGGSEDPGFDRFQAFRDQALRRMRRGEMEVKIQELIEQKRGAEGAGPLSVSTPEANAVGPFTRVGGTPAERPGLRPHLGQILDIMA